MLKTEKNRSAFFPSSLFGVNFCTFNGALLGKGQPCIRSWMSGCPLSSHFQGQKHHIVSLMDWASKKPSLYSKPSGESFSLAVNENKGKRWKEPCSKENKKGCTKRCTNVESRGEKVHYIWRETRDIGKTQWSNSFSVTNLVKFGRKVEKHLWKFSEENWQLGTENPFSHTVATLSRFQNAPGQSLHVKQTGYDVSLSRQQTDTSDTTGNQPML